MLYSYYMMVTINWIYTKVTLLFIRSQSEDKYKQKEGKERKLHKPSQSINTRPYKTQAKTKNNTKNISCLPRQFSSTSFATKPCRGAERHHYYIHYDLTDAIIMFDSITLSSLLCEAYCVSHVVQCSVI